MEEPWASYILRAKDPGEGMVTDSETPTPGGGGFTGGKQVRRKQRSRVTRWDSEGALMCVTVFSVKKMKK